VEDVELINRILNNIEEINRSCKVCVKENAERFGKIETCLNFYKKIVYTILFIILSILGFIAKPIVAAFIK
jgi:hypothetical protein